MLKSTEPKLNCTLLFIHHLLIAFIIMCYFFVANNEDVQISKLALNKIWKGNEAFTTNFLSVSINTSGLKL